MRYLTIGADTKAAPAVVWDVISDIRRWSEWGVTVRRAEASAHLVASGVRGRVQTRIGPWLPFEITRVDPGRYWTWRVAGIPATGHRVVPVGDSSRVEFTVAWPLAFYTPVLLVAAHRIRRLVEDE